MLGLGRERYSVLSKVKIPFRDKSELVAFAKIHAIAPPLKSRGRKISLEGEFSTDSHQVNNPAGSRTVLAQAPVPITQSPLQASSTILHCGVQSFLQTYNERECSIHVQDSAKSPDDGQRRKKIASVSASNSNPLRFLETHLVLIPILNPVVLATGGRTAELYSSRFLNYRGFSPLDKAAVRQCCDRSYFVNTDVSIFPVSMLSSTR